MDQSEKSPETTVVIRTFNEARHLPSLLERLRDQSYRDFEVVVVDSGSIDGTREIAEAQATRVIRIDRNHFTFGYSLNTGIREARGRLIAIASAHTLPVDDAWLGNLVAPLRAATVAMVYGRQVGAEMSKFSESQDFRRIFGLSRKVMRPPAFFANNANAAIRRELWEQYPFDEGLTGLEDVDWARQWMLEGYEVIYEPSAALHHIHEESRTQVRHRYYREGVAARRLGLKGKGTVVREVVREGGYLAADLLLAARGVLRRESNAPVVQRAREIVAFRLDKVVGTVRGLLDGAVLEDPGTRENLFFESSFDAVVISAPGQAALARIDMPEIRPGDVVIKVGFVGVCGTDLEIYRGTLAYFASGLGSYPIVPGHEVSGTVVATGTAVGGLADGDRVVVECIQSCDACPQCQRGNWIGCPDRRELGVLRANGGYAQFLVVPSRFVHRVPADVDLDRAALCEPLAVVLKGLDRLAAAWRQDASSKTCAIVGAGPVGHLCALVLAHRGHTVTVYDRDPCRLASFRNPWITTSPSLDGLGEFDAIVEATGNPEALEKVIGESRAGSATLLMGLPYARRNFDFESLVAYDKAVVGSVGSGAAHFEQALELLPRLDLDPYLRRVMPLDRFAEAWEIFRRHECLKVLLRAGEV